MGHPRRSERGSIGSSVWVGVQGTLLFGVVLLVEVTFEAVEV
jgi:hypothetical protein